MYNFDAMNAGDSSHVIVREIKLPGHGELHRFRNAQGNLLSAIYVDGTEVFSCERNRESSMISYWRNAKYLWKSNLE